jgi:ABC-type antimicrobial peptide transport system permease subunit
MDARIAQSFAIRRILAWLIAGFGAISGLLAAIGVNGVVAQFVAERRPEIGIRMALGAPPSQIVTRFMGQGLRPALAGVAVGVAVALSCHALLRSYLYEVSPSDPVLVGGAVTGVLFVLLIAMLWPSLRAARVDPQEVLRSE